MASLPAYGLHSSFFYCSSFVLCSELRLRPFLADSVCEARLNAFTKPQNKALSLLAGKFLRASILERFYLLV